MSQQTQPYRRSLSGSVGAGMKSVLGGGGRTYYMLVHKVSSKYHKAGESQPIIVDEIELGRGSQCQVRFDDSFTTVSRRHAAIVRDGENWKLVQLSTTNSTYLNGHHVEKEWYLQNGDEIQLSTNGPKLGFIIPEGEKSKVSSIGLTARLNLFRQQALRPYKTALTILSCVLLIALVGGGIVIHNQKKENELLQLAVETSKKNFEEEKARTTRLIDSLSHVTVELKESNDKLSKIVKSQAKTIVEIQKTIVKPSDETLDACMPYVYFIITESIDVRLSTGESGTIDCAEEGIGWTGTGFMLNDGTFVTARHVAEGWNFWRDGGGTSDIMYQLNLIANNGGSVRVNFVAFSSSGSRLRFSSDQFVCNRSHDQKGRSEDGFFISLAQLDNTDFAYIKMGQGQGLQYDASLSNNLKKKTELTVIGFPLGLGASSREIKPLVVNATVATDGLGESGMIITTDTGYESGNSGGPVFCTDSSGKLTVIGIVSAGAGRNIGMVVPISTVK